METTKLTSFHHKGKRREPRRRKETAPWRRTQRDERKVSSDSQDVGVKTAENHRPIFVGAALQTVRPATISLMMDVFHMAVRYVTRVRAVNTIGQTGYWYRDCTEQDEKANASQGTVRDSNLLGVE